MYCHACIYLSQTYASTLFSISTFKLITFFSDMKYFTVEDSLEVEKGREIQMRQKQEAEKHFKAS